MSKKKKQATPFDELGDETPILERLQKNYKHDEKKIRIWVARAISSAAETGTIANIKSVIIPIVDALLGDISEAVRIVAVEQLLPLSNTCKKFGSGASGPGIAIIKNDLFPLLLVALEDNEEEIRKVAVNTLQEYASFYSAQKGQFVTVIWPEIEKLANDKINEKNRIVAIEVLNKLASVLGKEKTISYSIPLLERLTSDPFYSVRAAIASNLENICDVIGDLTGTKIFPIWEQLAKDEIWIVRKACVDSIVILSQFLKKRDQVELVHHFHEFIEDDTRWVRSAAFSVVGQFIVTFPKESVVTVLVNYFKELAVGDPDNHKGPFYDCETVVKCAFSFPAVLITLGKDGWIPLKETFLILAHDSNWQTRSSVACSLHIVAGIIGASEIEGTLFPIIQEYTKDVDHIKLQILSHIVDILRLTTNGARENNTWLISFICNIQQNNTFWRFREVIGRQLGEIATLYSMDIVVANLIPLAKSLLVDPVAAVRRAVYKQVGFIIMALSKNEEEKFSFYNFLISFATHTWQGRIIFCKICVIVVEILTNEEFINIFLPSLLNLARDTVPNVRFQAAKSLFLIGNKIKNTQIQEALKELTKDKDYDIVLLLGTNDQVASYKPSVSRMLASTSSAAATRKISLQSSQSSLNK